jgi:hypothetical protein
MRRILIALVIFAVSVPGVASADWICKPAWKGVCGKQDCQRGAPEGELIRVQRDNGTYQLCTLSTGKCDAYKIDDIEQAGAFEFIRFNGVSYLKVATIAVELMGLEEGEFLEVRNGMLASISSGGQCVKE